MISFIGHAQAQCAGQLSRGANSSGRVGLVMVVVVVIGILEGLGKISEVAAWDEEDPDEVRIWDM